MEDLSKKLLEFRLKNNKTQSEMADELGVTQAHVSRIEKGLFKISPALGNKIASVVGERWRVSNLLPLNESDSGWRMSYYVMADEFSGDRVFISKKLKQKICIAHVDSEGHGGGAIETSDIFEVAFEAIAACFSELEASITASNFILSLDRVSKSLKKKWKVSSSCNMFILHKNTEIVSFVNAGMPGIYFYNSVEKNTKVIDQVFKTKPVKELSSTQVSVDTSLLIRQGDVLCSFSDGFLEFHKRSSSVDVEEYLSVLSRTLRGDAESIGRRLVKDIGAKGNNISSSDDISFLIIGKN